jgi:enoyl-CoA hydratase/carnithine racemase
MPANKCLIVNKVTPEYWKATFNNPPINLLNIEVFGELCELLDQIEADQDLKVIVFDSANPDFFIAHYDIASNFKPSDGAGSHRIDEWPSFVTRLSDSHVVSIASIRGRTRGVGSEFALACDMRFASREKAVFAQIEVGLGVVCGGGATEWLTAYAGRARTLEIICGADDFSAETAEKYGWINRALPDAELDGFVDNLARRIASFDKAPLELAKKNINARAKISNESERLCSFQSFRSTITWPETQRTINKALDEGLEQKGDFELRLAHHLAELHNHN